MRSVTVVTVVLLSVLTYINSLLILLFTKLINSQLFDTALVLLILITLFMVLTIGLVMVVIKYLLRYLELPRFSRVFYTPSMTT